MNTIFRISISLVCVLFLWAAPRVAAADKTAAAAGKDFYFRLDFANLFDNISPAFRQKLLEAPAGVPAETDCRTKISGFGCIFPQFNQKIRVEGRVIDPVEKNSLMSNFALVRSSLEACGGIVQEQKISGKDVQSVHFPQEKAWLRFSAANAGTTDILYISGGEPGDWICAPRELLDGAPALFSGEPQLAELALNPARLHLLLPKEHDFFRFFGKSALLTLSIKVRQDKFLFEFKADHVPEAEFPALKQWAQGLQNAFPGIRLTPSLAAGLLTMTGEVDMNSFENAVAVPAIPGMMMTE